jgi:hypothetical protein
MRQTLNSGRTEWNSDDSEGQQREGRERERERERDREGERNESRTGCVCVGRGREGEGGSMTYWPPLAPNRSHNVNNPLRFECLNPMR